MKLVRMCTIVCVLWMAPNLVVPAWAADRAAGDKQDLLKHFAGRWTWQGEQVDIASEASPYGQGGTFAGSSDSRFVLGGKFLLEEWMERSPEGNVLRGLNLTGYNVAKQQYTIFGLMNDGSMSVETFTFDVTIKDGRIHMTGDLLDGMLDEERVRVTKTP